MAKAITSHCYGIKCDNPKCNYMDMSVQFEDYPKYINKPCPKCGANLLTKHDYNVCKIIMSLSKIFGRIEVPDEAIDTRVNVKLNGTDDIEFEMHRISPQGKKGTR